MAERTRHLWWGFQVAAAEAEALHQGRPDEIADATAEPFESATARRAMAHRRARPGGARQGGVREAIPAAAGGLRTAAPRRLERRCRRVADRGLPMQRRR